MIIVDFNGDSLLDIVFYTYDGLSVGILLGDGKCYFQEQTLFSEETMGSCLELTVGNFNNDKHQDIISVISEPFSIVILLNTCGCCTGDLQISNVTDQ
jgi:hypothetical protein